MNDVELSILIICWRAGEHIVPCLDSVYRYTTRTRFEVVLINNSDDGLETLIAERYPRVRIIENHENLGFAVGNNRAAEFARGDYLLLLNPDTWLKDPAIDGLMDFAKRRRDGGVWGGVTELPDGRLDPGCNQHLPGAWHSLLETVGLSGLCRRGPKRTTPFEAEVPVLIGAFLLAKADLWRQIGGFDPWFVMYSDEADLAQRVRAAGRKVYMTSRCRIVHNVGGGKPKDVNRLIAVAKGRMTYVRKHTGRATVGFVGATMWISFFRRWLNAATKRASYAGDISVLWRKPGLWWAGWPKPGAEPRPDRATTLTSADEVSEPQK